MAFRVIITRYGFKLIAKKKKKRRDLSVYQARYLYYRYSFLQ